jgi:hypothetical protein
LKECFVDREIKSQVRYVDASGYTCNIGSGDIHEHPGSD